MAHADLDVLAIGSHPDDVELTCGGTLLKCADQGHRTGILDLTGGEMGTRGSAEIRAAEAAQAADLLGVSVRRSAGLADSGVFNTQETRHTLVAILRELRPTAVILPFPRGRHPDHRVGSELARDACFLAGLKRFGSGEPFRPSKLIYAASFREDAGKPTFVVNIEAQFDRKMEAIRCYSSQFDDAVMAGEAFPTGQSLYELIETQNRHYGSLVRRPFGEPFYTEETIEVDDISLVGVSTF
ncbi:MAG: bacillithiol biosynthesis deacetylase BshB1 [Gemmatimonadales bacterium]|nr:MAG: bacillithiol biosynthesis deacetylase BshB1 [Gemmatimonadales bacterium]